MQFDPLNDALVKMYNAEQAGKYEVSLFPASKLLGSVLQIMQSQGYVGQFERERTGEEVRTKLNSLVPLTNVVL